MSTSLLALLPLAGVLAAVSVALAIAWLVRRLDEQEVRLSALAEETMRFRQIMSAFRTTQNEMKERMDYAERVLTQVKEATREERRLHVRWQ